MMEKIDPSAPKPHIANEDFVPCFLKTISFPTSSPHSASSFGPSRIVLTKSKKWPDERFKTPFTVYFMDDDLIEDVEKAKKKKRKDIGTNE